MAAEPRTAAALGPGRDGAANRELRFCASSAINFENLFQNWPNFFCFYFIFEIYFKIEKLTAP